MNRALCSLFGHHFSETNNVVSQINEYSCVHCGKEVTTDVKGNLYTLTQERKEINQSLKHYYEKMFSSSSNHTDSLEVDPKSEVENRTVA